MAAAYASVVSVLHIIDKIKHHHASHIKSIGENPLIEALRERAISLQGFLESCNGVHDLVSRIADAAHATEDVLESHIVDRIHSVKEKKWTELSSEIRSSQFDQSMEKVIQDMDVIMEELEVEKATRDLQQLSIKTPSVLLPSTSSTLPPPSVETQGMVGFEEYLEQLLEKLTGQGLNRQVIPIFGMGGIGKTTLAKSVHAHPIVIQHFDRRAFVAISQQVNVSKILSGLLLKISGVPGEDYNKVGERLYKELWGRRYLIVLDDMWSVEAWDGVQLYFPDNGNGSRIIITSRISTLGSYIGSRGMKLDLLDDEKSWNLLCKKVFGDEGNFPDDEKLEKIGRNIAEKCEGLPLSIVTIGGLLSSKSHKTVEYWESILGNLNSIVCGDDNEHCLKILSLSYSHLPVHLKPCFLYMGILPEDYAIQSQVLVRRWVAEQFVKPNKDKCIEEVANDYLKDLVDRNLITFSELCWDLKKENTCSVHDLLRDLCLREVQKDKFLLIVNNVSNPKIESQRRLVLQLGMEDSVADDDAFVHDLESASLVRSFDMNGNKITVPSTYRLLRILDTSGTCLGCEVFEHVNMRYLSFKVVPRSSLQLPSSINLLWNLETLFIDGASKAAPIIAPVEIWGMPRLRYLSFYDYAVIPQPPSGQSNSNHENRLQEISYIMNFKLTEDVVTRIHSVRILGIGCDPEYKRIRGSSEDDDDCCCVVENLHRLIKLESLYLNLHKCPHSRAGNSQQLTNFPNSLKKLFLEGGKLPWESICIEKISLLPHLEVLILWNEAFTGDEWNAFHDSEQIFPSLKVFKIDGCPLKYWNADDTCFPRLEYLFLEHMDDLDEINLDIGNITTLKSIRVKQCSQGVVNSCKEILREQQSFGNDTIQIHISDDESEDGSYSESEDGSVDESDVVTRIHNVRHLEIECDPEDDCCVVENLHRLVKLESLTLTLCKCPHSRAGNWQQLINFPNSLKELFLLGGRLPWESLTKIGLLPHLEYLVLYGEAFTGDEWNAFHDSEQIFQSLKFFKIDGCPLKYWNADDTSFPRLEYLFLEKVNGLEEIPLDIGNIPTLESIHLKHCSQRVVDSAKQIQEQRLSFGNDTIVLYISDNVSDDESGDGLDDVSEENNENK